MKTTILMLAALLLPRLASAVTLQVTWTPPPVPTDGGAPQVIESYDLYGCPGGSCNSAIITQWLKIHSFPAIDCEGSPCTGAATMEAGAPGVSILWTFGMTTRLAPSSTLAVKESGLSNIESVTIAEPDTPLQPPGSFSVQLSFALHSLPAMTVRVKRNGLLKLLDASPLHLPATVMIVDNRRSR